MLSLLELALTGAARPVAESAVGEWCGWGGEAWGQGGRSWGSPGARGVLPSASSFWGKAPAFPIAPPGGWEGAGSPSGCRGGSGAAPGWASLLEEDGGLSACPGWGSPLFCTINVPHRRLLPALPPAPPPSGTSAPATSQPWWRAEPDPMPWTKGDFTGLSRSPEEATRIRGGVNALAPFWVKPPSPSC